MFYFHHDIRTLNSKKKLSNYNHGDRHTHQVYRTAPLQGQQKWRKAERREAPDFRPTIMEGWHLERGCCDNISHTWGSACITVSNRALIPFAILSSFRTLAILRTLITRIMVGLIGKTWPWISSRAMPIIERKTMETSSWFHLRKVLSSENFKRRLSVTDPRDISAVQELRSSFQLQWWRFQ